MFVGDDRGAMLAGCRRDVYVLSALGPGGYVVSPCRGCDDGRGGAACRKLGQPIDPASRIS